MPWAQRRWARRFSGFCNPAAANSRDFANPLVYSRPRQLPHTPISHHQWTRGLYRGGSRRSLARFGRGSSRVARHSDRSHRPRRFSSADRLRAKLVIRRLANFLVGTSIFQSTDLEPAGKTDVQTILSSPSSGGGRRDDVPDRSGSAL